MKNSGCHGNRIEKLEKYHKKIDQWLDFEIILQKQLLGDPLCSDFIQNWEKYRQARNYVSKIRRKFVKGF